MVLLVLSVLGVSIGTLTLGSYRLSDANRDDTSAYYVAEAGAVAAYEEIQSEVLSAYENNATAGSFYNNVSTIVNGQKGKSAIDFGEQFGTEPTATIRTEKASGTDPQMYTIYSTGNVDGKERTVTKQVTVEWVDKNTGGGGLTTLPVNAALLSQGKIKISGGTIQGDIYTNSTQNGGFTIDGWPNLKSNTLFYSNTISAEWLLKYPKDYVNFPKLVAKDKVWDSNSYFQGYTSLLKDVATFSETTTGFKKLPDKIIEYDKSNSYKVQDNGNLFLNNWMLNTYKLDVTDNIVFNKIIVGSGKTLTIDPMGGNHTILVDDLSVMSGTLNIVGKGTITMIVTGKMAFNHTSYINNPGTSDQLVIIYKGPTPNFNNITKMNAHVIVLGNKGPVNINGSTINGVVLTDNQNVNITGYNGEGSSNMMLISPNGNVTLSNAAINGTVIAEKFEMVNDGASLTYAAVNTTGFPFGSTAPAADPDPEDIISSEPIIEN
jgi:hypothetical protein